MRLRGGGEYVQLLAGLEQKTADVDDLASIDVEVQAVPDFARFRDVGGASAYGTTPALYQRNSRVVFLNESTLVRLAHDEQEAVVMHEVAHAFLHARGKSQPFGECVEADLLACRWGFADGLIRERSRSDPERGAALAKFKTDGEDAARDAMQTLHMRKLSGITKA